MAEISKPDYRYVWSSGGANVSPSNTKIQTGWTSEVPPYQWENYLQNRQDNMLVHINQHGIPQWDALTEYFANKSYTLGSDGVVYKAVQDSSPATTIQDPTTDTSDAYWTIAFASPGAFLTQTQGDARYLQVLNNGSDINNSATFRTNLGVYSKLEIDNKDLNSTRIDVASSATLDLNTLAPNTRHINITGTTNISAFTIAVGRCYFVRFAGALTLTNSATLVTQTGSNIITQAGATCILRATAANTVEILMYNAFASSADVTAGASSSRIVTPSALEGARPKKAQCNAWGNFNGIGTPALNDGYNVSGAIRNGNGNYTVQLINALDRADYAIAGISVQGTNFGGTISQVLGDIKTTTQCQIRTIFHGTSAHTFTDSTEVSFILFGGKN